MRWFACEPAMTPAQQLDALVMALGAVYAMTPETP